MYREVLEARCRVLGESHAYTLNSKRDLAVVLCAKGKWQEAEEMHREVLEVMRQGYGESNPCTLVTILSQITTSQMRDREDWQFRFSWGKARQAGRVNDAISAVREATARLQDRVDDDHPSLLRWGFALAELLLQMNTADCLQEAEALLLRLVPALQKRFGPKNPFVKRATGEFIFPTRGSGQS